MPLAEPLRVTLLLTEVLTTLGVPYPVGGSIANSLHGIPRATQDVDLVAALTESHVETFAGLLEATFYLDRDAIRDAIRRRASFNIIHLLTMLKLDVFVAQADAWSRAEFERACPISLPGGGSLIIARAEDTILHKLRWFELGGGISERQSWRRSPPSSAARVEQRSGETPLLHSSARPVRNALPTRRASSGWNDVLGVLKVCSGLDEEYLEKWASKLRLDELLRKAREESGC